VRLKSVKCVSFDSPSPVNKSIVRRHRDEWNQNPHIITHLHACLHDAENKSQSIMYFSWKFFEDFWNLVFFSCYIFFISTIWSMPG